MYIFSPTARDELPAPVRISLRPAAISLALGDRIALSFDGEGRLLTAFLEDHLFKRGFDHRIMEKWRDSTHPERLRRDLELPDKQALLARLRWLITRVLAALPAAAPEAIRERLARILTWDEAAYTCDAEQFRAIYRPVAILPPDQYLSVVLQPTEGCPYNRCLFCTFYRDQPFRLKSDTMFRTHVAAVKKYLGAGLGLRRAIFLADANALAAPLPRLESYFTAIHEAFAILPGVQQSGEISQPALSSGSGDKPAITGIYSFLDAFTNREQPDLIAAKFATLARYGLRRVYIGLESGHVPLLDFLRKPSLPDDVRKVVRLAKAADVHVGVIVMIGIGGQHYAAGHVRDSLAVLSSFDLGPGDLVYLSEFVDTPGSEYNRAVQTGPIPNLPLSADEIAAQRNQIRAVLREHFRAAPPKISTYDIREFIY